MRLAQERPVPDVPARRDPGDGATSAIHVGLLVERRYLSQAQPAGLEAALRARGHRVSVLDPQAVSFQLGDDRWLQGLDLLVARGRSWEVLCLLTWAETRGLPTINRRGAIAAVHNKAEMAVALAAGGVPMPRTLLGPARMLGSQVRHPVRSFPMVLKPMFGDNGQGLRVVRAPSELDRLEWPEPVALAQELVPGDGYERKVYGIGDEIWVVRRPALFGNVRGTPSAGEAPRPELVPATPAERELAVRCRRLFGLDLYGIDCIQTPQGPVVIEVNEFPNYTGVPEAGERLADHVLARASSVQERRPRPPEVNGA